MERNGRGSVGMGGEGKGREGRRWEGKGTGRECCGVKKIVKIDHEND